MLQLKNEQNEMMTGDRNRKQTRVLVVTSRLRFTTSNSCLFGTFNH